MLFGLYEQDLAAVALLGILANFLFSFLFGWHLARNIGAEELYRLKGNKRQHPLIGLSLAVPFAKMAITLFRVSVLQLYFLNRGRTYQEFWVHMTRDESEHT